MKKLLITTSALLAVASGAFANVSNGYQFDNAANVRDNLNKVYESFGGNFANLDITVPQTNNGAAADFYGDLLEHIDEVGDSTPGSVPMPSFIAGSYTPTISADDIIVGDTIPFDYQYVVDFTAQVSVDFVHISTDDVARIMQSHTDLANKLSNPAVSIEDREIARDAYVIEYNKLATIWNDAVDALNALYDINSATDEFTLGGVFNDTGDILTIGNYTYGSYTDWVTGNGTAIMNDTQTYQGDSISFPTQWTVTEEPHVSGRTQLKVEFNNGQTTNFQTVIYKSSTGNVNIGGVSFSGTVQEALDSLAI